MIQDMIKLQSSLKNSLIMKMNMKWTFKLKMMINSVIFTPELYRLNLIQIKSLTIFKKPSNFPDFFYTLYCFLIIRINF